VIECVINISEGRDLSRIAQIAAAAGDDLLDVHSDPDHNRSVITVVDGDAPRAVTRAGITLLDLRSHTGVHPRIGVVDVIPFVPLGDSTMDEALAARNHLAMWLAEDLEVPVFLYGPERTLPEIRRNAFTTLVPDRGPATPHPTAGAAAVGARPPMLAWNLWLASADLDAARAIARSIRGPGVRALGLQVGQAVQVSMNLIDPLAVGPAEVYDRVATMATIERAELVGLAPVAVLEATEPQRWKQLDLSDETTIEYRLRRRLTR